MIPNLASLLLDTLSYLTGLRLPMFPGLAALLLDTLPRPSGLRLLTLPSPAALLPDTFPRPSGLRLPRHTVKSSFQFLCRTPDIRLGYNCGNNSQSIHS